MSTIITIHLYSGVPDPSWELTEEQSAQLEHLLSLPYRETALRDPVSAGALGYRGFSLRRIGANAGIDNATVFDGIINVGGAVTPTLLDADSAVEQFLLKTGQHHLNEAESAYIAAAIQKNAVAGPGGTLRGLPDRLEPVFNPGIWNNDPLVCGSNNCYNYANNKITNTFAQPGRCSTGSTFAIGCDSTGQGARSDGEIPIASVASTPANGHYIALVIWPGRDYHWYRRDQNGQWSHKPGGTPAKNTDNSGAHISNPELCDRGPYTVFCGYFHCIPTQTCVR